MIYFNENEHEKYEHGTQQLKKIKQLCRRWAHLKISFWHLLVNLKNNYVFKKLLRWANEKCKEFHIYTIVFFQKNKEKPGNILHLSTKNLNDMIYSSWDIECDGLKLIILGQFLPFYPPPPPPSLKTQKKRNFEKMKKKKYLRHHHFKHVYQKSQWYDVRFLSCGVRWTECFVILAHFLPFYPPGNPENQNFEMEKSPGDVIILLMCIKNHNHDVWLLRYGVRQT